MKQKGLCGVLIHAAVALIIMLIFSQIGWMFRLAQFYAIFQSPFFTVPYDVNYFAYELLLATAAILFLVYNFRHPVWRMGGILLLTQVVLSIVWYIARKIIISHDNWYLIQPYANWIYLLIVLIFCVSIIMIARSYHYGGMLVMTIIATVCNMLGVTWALCCQYIPSIPETVVTIFDGFHVFLSSLFVIIFLFMWAHRARRS